jgi:predicted DNA-binding ribbon-helix-helix protein
MKTRLSLSAVSPRDRKRRRNPNSCAIKHGIRLAGSKTTVSLEDQFWDGLHEIAASEGVTMTSLIERIDINRTDHNLSSAIRVFVLDHFRTGSCKVLQIPIEAP